MLNLPTTSTLLRLVTNSSATLDVHASWIDLGGTTVTPGSTNTAISSATTTTIVPAPAASTTRNAKRINVYNRSAATSVTVTTQVYDGSTSFTLDSRVLGPGQGFWIGEDGSFYPAATGGEQTRPWFGQVAFAEGDGDPGRGLAWIQCGSNLAPTPTNITTSIARCSSFMLPFDLTVANVLWYGVGATTSIYTLALYQYSSRAQLSGPYTISTVANTWGSQTLTAPITLAKDSVYFIAVSANAIGTTAGMAAFGTSVAATTGQIAVPPTGLPGSLAMGSTSYHAGSLFQFSCTLGALPATAPVLSAQAAWTGGMPAFFLDAA